MVWGRSQLNSFACRYTIFNYYPFPYCMLLALHFTLTIYHLIFDHKVQNYPWYEKEGKEGMVTTNMLFGNLQKFTLSVKVLSLTSYWHFCLVKFERILSTARKTNVRLSFSYQLSVHFFIILFIHLFIFGCARSSLVRRLFSSCGKWALLSRCGVRAFHCGGFSWCKAPGLGHEGSVVVVPGLCGTGSTAVVHGLSCSSACGIFQDQGSNPCFLHWQVDF